jgi:fermentation-respiration switch protein FrsA (DUF1100 family)
MWIALTTAVVFYALWLAVLFLAQDRILFPIAMVPKPTGEVPPRAQVLWLDTDAGKVEAWFFPAPGASAEAPAPLVVFGHGNAEYIDSNVAMATGYNRMGLSVLMPEYRGYGRSAGSPSQRGIGADLRAFYQLIRQRPDVDATRIVFHGRSLGGAIVADLASHHRPDALILESTFTSAGDMAGKFLAPPLLIRHPFRTRDVVAAYDGPLLVFHGTRDEIIPVSNGRTLARLAARATYVEYDCMHNNFPGPGHVQEYWRQIEQFLRQHGLLREP